MSNQIRYNDFRELVRVILPEANFTEDDEGQIIIHSEKYVDIHMNVPVNTWNEKNPILRDQA